MTKSNKATKATATVVVAQEQVVHDLTAYTTKSAKIRYLASTGMTRSAIVKYFKEVLNDEIIYQHVRNVLTQQLKKPVAQ